MEWFVIFPIITVLVWIRFLFGSPFETTKTTKTTIPVEEVLAILSTRWPALNEVQRYALCTIVFGDPKKFVPTMMSIDNGVLKEMIDQLKHAPSSQHAQVMNFFSTIPKE